MDNASSSGMRNWVLLWYGGVPAHDGGGIEGGGGEEGGAGDVAFCQWLEEEVLEDGG